MGMMTNMQGRRGDSILVNGTPDAFASVPNRLLRLRFENGANSRIFDLPFYDGRAFHWIASEGGLLEKPVELRSLTLAPGERTEILVDLSDGRSVVLKTLPDTNFPMMLGPMGGVQNFATEMFGAGNEIVLRFEPTASDRKSGVVLSRLIARKRMDASQVTKRRQFVLTMGMGMGGMMGG